MKFRYWLVQNKVRIPIVPIGIFYGGGPFHIACLVDSGADVSFLPKDYAAVLGIADYKTGVKKDIMGVTQHHITTYGHEVMFTLGGWPHKESFYVGDVGQDMGILGRSFFENYKVIFDQRAEEVEFRPYLAA